MNWNFSIAIAAVISCILLCAYFIWRNYKKMQQTLDKVLKDLDMAIGGNFQDVLYDESIDGAIAERLNRMVQITNMQKEAAQRERDAIKSLVSNISHQIRTPLTNIMLYTGLLKEQRIEKEASILIDKIQKQSLKLDFFMKELVKSSYAEQEMIAVSPKIVLADELIGKACQSVELQALKKNISINCTECGFYCFADPKWTVEALANIIENAVKYSDKDSVVEISTISYESFLCVQIKDYGIGIKEEEQGLIFKRFYRSPAVAQEAGFGIGLYLVREVLIKQGGYVKVWSRPGKGSVFFVYLSKQ